jgi:hypothetical protein
MLVVNFTALIVSAIPCLELALPPCLNIKDLGDKDFDLPSILPCPLQLAVAINYHK